MPIQRGDFVRPNNNLYLPQGSVWRVICSTGALKLEPENAAAQRVGRSAFAEFRFPAQDFDKVMRCRGQWVSVRDAELPFDPPLFVSDDMLTPSPQNLPETMFTEARPDAVATATIAAEQAASTTAAIDRMLEAARKLEAERQEELRIAKAAKAKADKEAAARAKAEEACKALDAKLHADRCLAEATLELIAEVGRLNNWGSEQVAHPSIAAHVEQLQPLAKSYGYRIVKPSMLAMVIKL